MINILKEKVCKFFIATKKGRWGGGRVSFINAEEEKNNSMFGKQQKFMLNSGIV